MIRLTYALTGSQPGEEDHFFVDALDPARWRPLSQGDDPGGWDALWTVGMPTAEAFQRVQDGRTVNHIPGNGCVTVKSALADTLGGLEQRLAAAHGSDSDPARRARFHPRTFVMPRDRDALRFAAAGDPGQLWLQKPENSSRGRGIALLSTPAAAPAEPGWIVQSYQARPHLIDGRKYVLRLYVLIRSVEPLRVYLYGEGFAKLASRPYTLESLHDPFVHQTNPDINAGNRAVDDPVVFIELADYRQRLRREGHDPEALFHRLRELITITMLAGRETMRRDTLARGADPGGCYELLGLDCLVDTELQPWLLECNLNPSLGVFAAPADGGRREAAIKRAMVEDLVNLVGLNADPEADEVATLQREAADAGGFERLYPGPDPADQWQFLPYPRPSDARVVEALQGSAPPPPPLRPWRVREQIDEQGLHLYDETRERWLAPNPTAALIWLHAVEGRPPAAIAARLPGAEDPAAVTAAVWETLADWARDGLLIQAPPDS